MFIPVERPSRYTAFSRTGSFWTELLDSDSETRVKPLPSDSIWRGALMGLSASVGGLVYGSNTRVVENEIVRWDAADALFIGPDLAAKIVVMHGTTQVVIRHRDWLTTLNTADNPNILGTSDDHILVDSEGNWLLFWEPGAPDVIDLEEVIADTWGRTIVFLRNNPYLTPATVMRPDTHEMLLNTDPLLGFSQGHITLEGDARELGNVLVCVGFEKQSHWLNYSHQSGDDRDAKDASVIRYFSGYHTPKSLFAAACASAGIFVPDVDLKVVEVFQENDTTTSREYRLVDANGQEYPTLKIERPHTELEVLSWLPAWEPVAPPAVLHYDNKSMWWKSINWQLYGSRLSLDGLCGVQGLALANEPARWYSDGEEGGNQLARFDFHVYDDLEPDEDAGDRFWASVRSAELISEVFLNDLVELADENDEKWVNNIDFFLGDPAWGSSILIVELPGTSAAVESAIEEFMREHRILGLNLVFLRPTI